MNRGNVEYSRWFDLRPRFSTEGERQPGEEEDLLFAAKFKSPCRKPVSTRARLAWVKNKPVGPFAGSIHANFASIRQAAMWFQWARGPMGLPARSGEEIRRSWLSASVDVLPMYEAGPFEVRSLPGRCVTDPRKIIPRPFCTFTCYRYVWSGALLKDVSMQSTDRKN